MVLVIITYSVICTHTEAYKGWFLNQKRLNRVTYIIVYRTDLWLTRSRMTCWFVTIQADCSYWNKALIFIASRFFKFHEVFQPVNFKFYVYVLWSCNAFALDLALGNLMVSTFVWTNPLSCHDDQLACGIDLITAVADYLLFPTSRF